MEGNQSVMKDSLEGDSIIGVKKYPNMSVFYFDQLLGKHVRRNSVFSVEYLHSDSLEKKHNNGSSDNDLEPKETSADNLMNDFVEASDDVDLVMDQTHCSYQNAVYALRKHKGDVVEAIIEVTS